MATCLVIDNPIILDNLPNVVVHIYWHTNVYIIMNVPIMVVIAEMFIELVRFQEICGTVWTPIFHVLSNAQTAFFPKPLISLPQLGRKVRNVFSSFS